MLPSAETNRMSAKGKTPKRATNKYTKDSPEPWGVVTTEACISSDMTFDIVAEARQSKLALYP